MAKNRIALIVFTFLAANLDAPDVAAQTVEPLTWTAATVDDGESKEVNVKLDFVRGGARIIRRPGPTTVEVFRTSVSGRGATVTIDVELSGGNVTFRDRYPVRTMTAMTECLPAATERGDFWHSDVLLYAVIRAADDASIDIKYMDDRLFDSSLLVD